MKCSRYHSLLVLTRTLCAISTIALIAAVEVEAQDPILYGIQRLDAGGFQLVRVDLDTGETDILHHGQWMESLAIDVQDSMLYWANMGEIFRSNLDGSDVQTILDLDTFEALRQANSPQEGTPCDHNIALDLVGKKIYSIGQGWCSPHSLRSNLDGSDLEWLNAMDGLAPDIDPVGHKVYWSTYRNRAGGRWLIMRANLDGSHQEIVTSSSEPAYDLRINGSAREIYWMNPTGVFRTNLDGTDSESLVTVSNWYGCFALDESNHKIYFTAGWPFQPGFEPNFNLFRSDMDGSNFETVQEGMRLVTFVLDEKVNTSTGQDLPRPYTHLTLYPNPFRQSTKVSYTLTRPVHVEARIIDMLGREVITLGSGFRLAGTHQLTIDGARLPSGIYLLQIQAAGFLETKSLVLTK